MNPIAIILDKTLDQMTDQEVKLHIARIEGFRAAPITLKNAIEEYEDVDAEPNKFVKPKRKTKAQTIADSLDLG